MFNHIKLTIKTNYQVSPLFTYCYINITNDDNVKVWEANFVMAMLFYLYLYIWVNNEI